MSQLFKRSEVEKHATDNDCWIIIENNVYDVTKFLDDHPGDYFPIVEYAGKDATKAFVGKPHSQRAYSLLPKFLVGRVEEPVPEETPKVEQEVESASGGLKVRKDLIPFSELEIHDSKASVWVLIHGRVYDVTGFKSHPGSFEKLVLNAGTDATKEFDRVGHKESSKKMMEKFYIGDIDPSTVVDRDSGPAAVQKNRLFYILMMVLVSALLYCVGYYGA